MSIRLAQEATRGCREEMAKRFFDGISEEPEPLIDYDKMTRDEILEYEEIFLLREQKYGMIDLIKT